jgi:hypothetical protein
MVQKKANLNVNCGPQLIIIYDYLFINSNKCTTLKEDVNKRTMLGDRERRYM